MRRMAAAETPASLSFMSDLTSQPARRTSAAVIPLGNPLAALISWLLNPAPFNSPSENPAFFMAKALKPAPRSSQAVKPQIRNSLAVYPAVFICIMLSPALRNSLQEHTCFSCPKE